MGRARLSRTVRAWSIGLAASLTALGAAGWSGSAVAGPGAGVAASAAAAVKPVPSPAIAFTTGPGSPLPVGGDPFALVKTATRPPSGDFDLEIPDLVVVNPATRTITALLGDGHGGYTLAPGTPVSTGGSGPSAIVASGEGYFRGNLPGTGPGGMNAGSVVVANSGTNTLSLLFGNGAGGFSLSPQSPFASGGVDPTALAALAGTPAPGASAAVPPFLAVANSGSASVSVLTARADGTGYAGVVPGSPFATGLHSISAMVAGDFNGDGKPDLALVDGSGASSANVAILLGDGHGSLSPAPGSPFSSGGSSPDAIAVDDFNDDGTEDVVVANHASNTVSVLIGRGNGSFALAPGSPFASGGSGPTGVAPWDFNGDGRADLAVINGGSNNVDVYAGDGTGRLTAQPGFPVPTGGTGPDAIVAGDLNGDLLGDLAIANRQSHSVSVLLNSTLASNFPLTGRTRTRRDGGVTLHFSAPAAGLFQALLSVTTARGKVMPYGCGEARPRRAGPVSMLVEPFRRARRVFHRVRTLRLQSRTSFLRVQEVAPVPLVSAGGSVRHVARRGRHPRRVIVHVAARRGAVASGAGAAVAGTPLPTLLANAGCTPFPSL